MAVKAPWYDRAMNTLKWLVIFMVLGYGVIVALLYFGQRAMQYFPERFRTAPAAAGLPGAEEVVLDTPDRGPGVARAGAPARGKAGGALFPRQWRLAARTGRSLSRSDRRRHRARGAQLPRLWRLERRADRGGPRQRRVGGLCLHARALPGGMHR